MCMWSFAGLVVSFAPLEHNRDDRRQLANQKMSDRLDKCVTPRPLNRMLKKKEKKNQKFLVFFFFLKDRR